jgi:hypothetical protein
MKLIAEIPSVSVPNFLFGVVVVPIMALTMYDTDRIQRGVIRLEPPLQED